MVRIFSLNSQNRTLDFTNRTYNYCNRSSPIGFSTVRNDFFFHLIRTCEQIAEQGRAPSTNKRMEGGDSEYSEQVQHRFGRL